MPIKNPALYPAKWLEIVAEIRKRSGNRCEGSPRYPACRAENGQPHPVTGSRVVLTVGHLDHDPANCAPENLRHWCQRCHLTYDAKMHAKHAALTRWAKKRNLELFGAGRDDKPSPC